MAKAGDMSCSTAKKKFVNFGLNPLWESVKPQECHELEEVVGGRQPAMSVDACMHACGHHMQQSHCDIYVYIYKDIYNKIIGPNYTDVL